MAATLVVALAQSLATSNLLRFRDTDRCRRLHQPFNHLPVCFFPKQAASYFETSEPEAVSNTILD